MALALALVGAIASSLGSVAAGRLADSPTSTLLTVLALCVVGGAFVDTAARTIWGVVVDRAEGQLRADLIDAAMAQPLAELSEQAVGEVLDRIDDDTWEVGQLMRWGVWMALRTLLSAGPLWIVASVTWWPAAFLFPLCGVVVWFFIRRLLPQVAERKVLEEAAWTDHAASTEEGVAARDDIRTSLGQPHVLRRNAELAAEIHRRLRRVLAVEVSITRRSGSLLHAVLAGTGLIGIALVLNGDLSTARLVTLFLVTTMFVGQVDMLARHLPDLQEGMGAVLRLRGMMSVPAEPTGGLPVPHGPLDVELRGLAFSYGTGTFALRDVDLGRPGGSHVCARRPYRARASPPSPRCCPAGSSRRAARCSSAGSTCATSTSSSCGPRSAWSPSAPRSWPAASPTTSRSSATPRASRSSPRSRSSASPTGWPGCPRASTRCSVRAAPACRPARSSWWRSPACWCAT